MLYEVITCLSSRRRACVPEIRITVSRTPTCLPHVITSYSIHYTKLYETRIPERDWPLRPVPPRCIDHARFSLRDEAVRTACPDRRACAHRNLHSVRGRGRGHVSHSRTGEGNSVSLHRHGRGAAGSAGGHGTGTPARDLAGTLSYNFV